MILNISTTLHPYLWSLWNVLTYTHSPGLRRIKFILNSSDLQVKILFQNTSYVVKNSIWIAAKLLISFPDCFKSISAAQPKRIYYPVEFSAYQAVFNPLQSTWFKSCELCGLKEHLIIIKKPQIIESLRLAKTFEMTKSNGQSSPTLLTIKPCPQGHLHKFLTLPGMRTS